MNEFDIFIRNIVLDCIREQGTCSNLCQEDDQLTFYVDIENHDNVIARKQFKVTYPISYSIKSALIHEIDLLRYLDSGEIRTPFTTDIVEVLKSELQAFMFSNKPRGEYHIC
ncbi:hypothetical protein NQS96_02350 [Pseudoalteromonas shioyasakiensis]|jgi:hypothetical protein|uniref:hypothetical protein n=1 Tax=Pseudoalteromonas TaxID=53246 RepID=UPI00143188A6|nr:MULTISPECIES: hypothetical protein [Pseudoalteromonas]MCQ8880643.1 hypothetical protein [Pseudoalteromonas shioyasakiensis]NIZ04194.1 hypothetical protein [Pseudoalteromonas sp. HF66]